MKRLFLTAAILAAGVNAAHADNASVHLTLSDFGLSVIDLTPDDGVLPPFEIVPNKGSTVVYFSGGPTGQQSKTPGFFTSLPSPVDLTLPSSPSSSGTVHVDSNGFEFNSTLQGIHGTSISASINSSLAPERIWSEDSYIRLAPGSGIVATGHAAASTSCTDAFGVCLVGANISVYFSEGILPRGETFSASAGVQTNDDYLNHTFDTAVKASYLNNSSEVMILGLHVEGYTNIWSFDPPVVTDPPETTVPEPSTYGLLLAGLAGVGLARRRRT